MPWVLRTKFPFLFKVSEEELEPPAPAPEPEPAQESPKQELVRQIAEQHPILPLPKIERLVEYIPVDRFEAARTALKQQRAATAPRLAEMRAAIEGPALPRARGFFISDAQLADAMITTARRPFQREDTPAAQPPSRLFSRETLVAAAAVLTMQASHPNRFASSRVTDSHGQEVHIDADPRRREFHVTEIDHPDYGNRTLVLSFESLDRVVAAIGPMPDAECSAQILSHLLVEAGRAQWIVIPDRGAPPPASPETEDAPPQEPTEPPEPPVRRVRVGRTINFKPRTKQ